MAYRTTDTLATSRISQSQVPREVCNLKCRRTQVIQYDPTHPTDPDHLNVSLSLPGTGCNAGTLYLRNFLAGTGIFLAHEIGATDPVESQDVHIYNTGVVDVVNADEWYASGASAVTGHPLFYTGGPTSNLHETIHIPRLYVTGGGISMEVDRNGNLMLSVPSMLA